MRTLLGVILLLLVGCTGIAQAEGLATNEDDLEAQVKELTERLEFLEGNVEELELLQWRHEDRVVALVREELWLRASSCLFPACYQVGPMLQAFYKSHEDYRLEAILNLINDAEWSAERVSEAVWIIEARAKSEPPIVFLADSMYRTICWEPLLQCI